MARRLIRHIAFCSVLLPVLHGCVSTEELYAEYDDEVCKVVVERVENDRMILHETVSDTYFDWVPAVYFGFDASTLDSETRKRLDTDAKILRTYPELLIGVQGFTDRLGGGAYNRALAGRRVSAVANYLRGKGVRPARMVLQPIGAGLPNFGDDDELARAANRRVELMLLDELGRPLHPRFDSAEIEGEAARGGRAQTAAGPNRPERTQSSRPTQVRSSPVVDTPTDRAPTADAESRADSRTRLNTNPAGSLQ